VVAGREILRGDEKCGLLSQGQYGGRAPVDDHLNPIGNRRAQERRQARPVEPDYEVAGRERHARGVRGAPVEPTVVVQAHISGFDLYRKSGWGFRAAKESGAQEEECECQAVHVFGVRSFKESR
jgi:hypothetical protein